MANRMLWYKAWLDTRWRFLIALFVLTIAACGVVLSYPRALVVMDAAARLPPGTLAGGNAIADRIAEAVSMAGSYRGYIFTQLFRQELPQLWCLFALALGAGGIGSQAARGGGLFTLSLPVSRLQIVSARAGVVLVELLALALIPAIAVSALSPVVGHSYNIADGLVHGALLFFGGAVFFSVTFVLSTVFTDVWRPPLIMAALFAVIAVLRSVVPGFTRFTLAPVITGGTYFLNGSIPWTALLLSMVTSAVLLVLAARIIARRDF